jgi:hypothetical protein
MAQIRIVIGGDDRDFNNAASRVEQRSKRMARNVKRDGTGFEAFRDIPGASIAEKFGKAMRSPVALAGGAIAGAAFTLRHAMQEAGRIADMSARANINPEEFQAQAAALELSGGSPEDLAQAYNQLAKARKAALNGSAEMLANFKALGVSAEDLKGKRLEQLFYQISRAIQAAGDNQVILADALEVLGKSAATILPALSDGFEGAARSAKELGLVISAENIKRLDEYGDKWAQLWKKIKVGAASAGAFIAEGHQTGADTFDRIFAFFRGGPKELQRVTDEQESRGKPVFGAPEKTGKASGADEAAAKESTLATLLKQEAQDAEKLTQAYREMLEVQERLSALRMDDAQQLAAMEQKLERLKNNRAVAASEYTAPEVVVAAEQAANDARVNFERIRDRNLQRGANPNTSDAELAANSAEAVAAKKLLDAATAALSRVQQNAASPTEFLDEDKAIADLELRIAEKRKTLQGKETPGALSTTADERARVGGFVGAASGLGVGGGDLAGLARQQVDVTREVRDAVNRATEAIRSSRNSSSVDADFYA